MCLRPSLFLTLVLITTTALAQSHMPIAIAQEHVQDGMPPLPRPRPDPDELPQAAPVPMERPGRLPVQTPAIEAISALTATPQPVLLEARITEDSPPISDGLVWRIFDTTPDASGELALVAKSEQGRPQITLSPGEYIVHLAYGQAQTSSSLSIMPGQNAKTFIIDAGGLRLNGAVTGDIPIPATLLDFDVFTAGEENDRAHIARNVKPNDILTLNAGTYHIVSYFGAINAVVRADLRVETGQLTDATLYHHASQVSFKLASEAGGEAIADVDWTVQTPDGETIFTELGAFPATVLSAGTYLVLARQGSQNFSHEFQVQPGPPVEIEVLASSD